MKKHTPSARGSAAREPISWESVRTGAALLVIGLSGFAWLVGSLVEHSPFAGISQYAGILFVFTFCLRLSMSFWETRRREKRYQQSLRDRKERMSEMQAEGFSPTLKLLGSSRLFAVDAKRRKWCLIEYYNHPRQARLYGLDAIAAAFKAPNREYAPYNAQVLLFNGRALSAKDRVRYDAAQGVAIRLREAGSPVVFVNCFKTENDADLILQTLHSLLEAFPAGEG